MWWAQDGPVIPAVRLQGLLLYCCPWALKPIPIWMTKDLTSLRDNKPIVQSFLVEQVFGGKFGGQ